MDCVAVHRIAMAGTNMMIPEDQALAGSKRGRDDADAISRFTHAAHTYKHTQTYNNMPERMYLHTHIYTVTSADTARLLLLCIVYLRDDRTEK